MTRLKFSDGMEFDTSGPLRIEERRDGLYGVGAGMLCAVGSREEAEELLRDLKARMDEKGGSDGREEEH